MKRYVVSAPRSGLNWVRFNIEHFYGLKTPGKTLLIDEESGQDDAFIRSHDALLNTPDKSDNSGAYNYIDPAGTADDIVVLLLRDPLESFVRMARSKFSDFDNKYVGNIRFFCQAAARRKGVWYYDELVSDPLKMAALMRFLELIPADGREIPSDDQIVRDSAGLEERSRKLYDRNQWHSGGATTKKDPKNFKFHQSKLSAERKRQLWKHLDEELAPEELDLVERFRPTKFTDDRPWYRRLL